MILSNYEEFMQFVPTTFDSNQDIELFREWVDIAEYTAGFNLFGTELYQAISALPDNDNFRVLCKRYICHSALYEAIPNLDLILTPNGFAWLAAVIRNLYRHLKTGLQLCVCRKMYGLRNSGK